MRLHRKTPAQVEEQKAQHQEQITRYQNLIVDTDELTKQVLQHAKDNTMADTTPDLLLARIQGPYYQAVQALVKDAETAVEKQALRKKLQKQQQLWILISILQPAEFDIAVMGDTLRSKEIGPVGVALPADYRDVREKLDTAVAAEAKDSEGAMFLSLPTPAMEGASITQATNDRLARMTEGLRRGVLGLQGEKRFQVVKPARSAEHASALLALSHDKADLDRLQHTAQLSGAVGATFEVNNKLQINLASYQAVLDAMANTHAVTDAVLSSTATQASAVATQSFTAHPIYGVAEGGSGVRLPNVLLAEAVHRASMGVKVLLVDTDEVSAAALRQGLENVLLRLRSSGVVQQNALAGTLEANIRFLDLPADQCMTTAKGVKVVAAEGLKALKDSGFEPALSLCSYQMAVPYVRKDWHDLLSQLPGKLVVVPQGGNRRSDIINAMSAAVHVCQRRSIDSVVIRSHAVDAGTLARMSVLTTQVHVAEAGIATGSGEDLSGYDESMLSVMP
ncbi:MAG: hypothetical protein P1U63_10125 [Coxiellaceae bacterium]|nr:hypothetical protein [Coxiellaceae bacterium]